MAEIRIFGMVKQKKAFIPWDESFPLTWYHPFSRPARTISRAFRPSGKRAVRAVPARFAVQAAR